MAEIVNLRIHRRQAARAEARRAAAESAARHGQRRADKALHAAQAEKANRDLAGHRRERAPADPASTGD